MVEYGSRRFDVIAWMRFRFSPSLCWNFLQPLDLWALIHQNWLALNNNTMWHTTSRKKSARGRSHWTGRRTPFNIWSTLLDGRKSFQPALKPHLIPLTASTHDKTNPKNIHNGSKLCVRSIMRTCGSNNLILFPLSRCPRLGYRRQTERLILLPLTPTQHFQF